MEEDKVRFKFKYLFPICGGVIFYSDNKECRLDTIWEAFKFASLSGIMYLYHYGSFAALYFHKEIANGLEHLIK